MVWSVSLTESPMPASGALKVEILGLAGLAKISDGDSFEVYVKHGEQKYKSTCAVKEGTQVWVDKDFTLDVSFTKDILIKVLEIKGTADVVIGCVSCPTEDFVSENPQICIIPINKLGTMKLRLKILWIPVVEAPDVSVTTNNISAKHIGVSPISPLLDSVTVTVGSKEIEEASRKESKEEHVFINPNKKPEVAENTYIIRGAPRESITSEPRSPETAGKPPTSPAGQPTIELYIPPPPTTPPPPIPSNEEPTTNRTIVEYVKQTSGGRKSTVDNPTIIYQRQQSTPIVLCNATTQTEQGEALTSGSVELIIPPPPAEPPPQPPVERTPPTIVKSVAPVVSPPVRTPSPVPTGTEKRVLEYTASGMQTEKIPEAKITSAGQPREKLVIYIPPKEPVTTGSSQFGVSSPQSAGSRSASPVDNYDDATIPIAQRRPQSLEIPSPRDEAPPPAIRHNKRSGHSPVSPDLPSPQSTGSFSPNGNGYRMELITHEEPLRDHEAERNLITNKSTDEDENNIIATLMELSDVIQDKMERSTFSVLPTLKDNVDKLKAMLRRRNRRNSVTPSIESALNSFGFLEKHDQMSVKSSSLPYQKQYRTTHPADVVYTMPRRQNEAKQLSSWMIVRKPILHHLQICLDLLGFLGVSVGPLRHWEFKAVSCLERQNDIIGTLVRLWLTSDEVTVVKACPLLEKAETLYKVWTICVTDNPLLCESSVIKRAFVAFYNMTEKVGEDDPLCQEVCVKATGRLGSQGRLTADNGRISVFQFNDFFTETKIRSVVIFLRGLKHELRTLYALRSSDDLVVLSVLREYLDIPLAKSCLRIIAVLFVTGDKAVKELAEIFIKKIPPEFRQQVANIFLELLEDKHDLVRGGSCLCLAKLEHHVALPHISYLSKVGTKTEQPFAKVALNYMNEVEKSTGFPMIR